MWFTIWAACFYLLTRQNITSTAHSFKVKHSSFSSFWMQHTRMASGLLENKAQQKNWYWHVSILWQIPFSFWKEQRTAQCWHRHSGLTACTAEFLQLSFTGSQGVPVGKEKMGHPYYHRLYPISHSHALCLWNYATLDARYKNDLLVSPVFRHVWKWHDNKGNVLALICADGARSHTHNEILILIWIF